VLELSVCTNKAVIRNILGDCPNGFMGEVSARVFRLLKIPQMD